MHKSFWTEQITVGNLTFPRFMAAPLDGITDSPLRQLIRTFSPQELLFGEMRHVACVVNEKDDRSLRYDSVEHPVAFQVSANIPRFIDEAIEKIIRYKFDMFNLNAGCPASNVTKSGSGSALMADIPRLVALLQQMRTALAGRIPLTLKIRAGFKVRNAREVAVAAQDAGVEMLIIHPRTAPEGFVSRLDFESAKLVKEAVSIPVVFSGNITSFERAKKMYEMTGVDGFMIGRALWGCPWKMAEMTTHARGETFEMSVNDAMACAMRHFELNVAHYGPWGFCMFKKQAAQYIRGIAHAPELRKELLTSQTEQAMREILQRIVQEGAQ